MKIDVLDHGYVSLVETWGSDERIIEAARMSTSKGFEGWDKDAKLLAYLYNNQHMTPFEMCGAIIEVKAPIFVFREWHRHRTQSYNEMSARYIPIPDEHYVPSVERIMAGANTATTNKQAQGNGKHLSAREARWFKGRLMNLHEEAQAAYMEALELGIPKELARLVMPVSRYSKMRASANLRNWLAFLKLRQDESAQWEIRVYADAVASIIEAHFPRTFALFNQNKHAVSSNHKAGHD